MDRTDSDGFLMVGGDMDYLHEVMVTGRG